MGLGDYSHTLEKFTQHDNVSDLYLGVRFEAFTAATMKNVVFWDIKPMFLLHRRHIAYTLQSSAS
jgi:hypothetical protein